MDPSEILLYTGTNFLVYVEDKRKLCWVGRKLIVTNLSISFINKYNQPFDFPEGKISLKNKEIYYLNKSDLQGLSYPDENLAISRLTPGYSHVIAIVDGETNNCYFFGTSNINDARNSFKAISISISLIKMSDNYTKKKLGLRQIYQDWAIKECREEFSQFIIGPELLQYQENDSFLQFTKICTYLKNVILKGLVIDDLNKSQLERMSRHILPQQLIKIRFEDCDLLELDVVSICNFVQPFNLLTHLGLTRLNIIDDSLMDILRIFPSLPFLKSLEISECHTLKGERNLDNFIYDINLYLALEELNLSSNSLGSIAADILMLELLVVDNLSMKKIDLSNNRFPHVKLYNMYRMSKFREGLSKISLNLGPFPIYQKIFEDFLSSVNLKNTVFEFKRVTIESKPKRQTLSLTDLAKVDQLRKEIHKVIIKEKSVEDIQNICQEIQSLEFDFPPQHTERLRAVITDMLFRSCIDTSNQDLYVFGITKSAGDLIDVVLPELEEHNREIEKGMSNFAKDLCALLNFEFPEEKLNSLLDTLVNKAISCDLRGDAIDILFYLKERRDKLTNSYIREGILQEEIQEETSIISPFYILEHDPKLKEDTKHMKFNKNYDWMGIHPCWVDYIKLSESPRAQLTHIANKPLMEEDTIVQEKKQLRAAYMISEHGIKEFPALRHEHLLHISRVIHRYRWFVGQEGPPAESTSDRMINIVKDRKKIKNIAKREIYSKDEYIQREKEMIAYTSLQSIQNNQTSISEDKHSLSRPDNMNIEKIRGPMDTVSGLGICSIQKLPKQYSTHDYRFGVEMFSYLLKICKLNLEQHTDSIIELIQSFLKLVRSQDRREVGIYVISGEFLIGEIYLNIIKFIDWFSQFDNSKDVIRNGRNTLTLAIGLFAVISHLLRPSPDIATFALDNLNDRILTNKKVEEKLGYNSAHQLEIITTNISDYIEYTTFIVTPNYFPLDNSILIFMLKDRYHEIYLDLTIRGAKKIKKKQMSITGSIDVDSFVTELKSTGHLFAESNLNKHTFWLFLEINEYGVEDIPLNYEMKMNSVYHLYQSCCSNFGQNNVRMVFKERIFSIRDRYNIRSNLTSIINCRFVEEKRKYIVKDYYCNYFTTTKLIEIGCLLHLIRVANLVNKLREKEKNEPNAITNKEQIIIDSCRLTGILDKELVVYNLSKIVPSGSLHFFSEEEWISKFDSFYSNNIAMRRLKYSTLITKFLNFLINCPVFGSSVYHYEVQGEKVAGIGDEGYMVINVFGVYFYPDRSFKEPTIYSRLEDFQRVEDWLETAILEILIEKNNTSVIMLNSSLKTEFVLDIITYMLIALRESKKLFCAYRYIGRYISQGKDPRKLGLDPMTQAQIEIVYENIYKGMEEKVQLASLPFTNEYQSILFDQSTGIQKKHTLRNSIFAVKNKLTLEGAVHLIQRKNQVLKTLEIAIPKNPKSKQKNIEDENMGGLGSRRYMNFNSKMKTPTQLQIPSHRDLENIDALKESPLITRGSPRTILRKATIEHLIDIVEETDYKEAHHLEVIEEYS